MTNRAHLVRQLAQQDQQLSRQRQQIVTQGESIACLLGQQNDLLRKHKTALERLVAAQEQLKTIFQQRNTAGRLFGGLWQQTLVVCEQAILTLPPGSPVRVAAEVLLEGRCRRCGRPLAVEEERCHGR